MRLVKSRNILDEFCTDFCSVVQEFCNYVVVSGFVAISSGRARGTEDIDIILERINKEEFKKIYLALKKKGFECVQTDSAQEIYEYLNDNLSARFVRVGEMIPDMELKLAKDELDEYQLQTKTKLELTGLDIWFSSINMNIAFKEHLLKSDKDLEDAKHLRVVYFELVDEEEIKKICTMIDRYRL